MFVVLRGAPAACSWAHEEPSSEQSVAGAPCAGGGGHVTRAHFLCRFVPFSRTSLPAGVCREESSHGVVYNLAVALVAALAISAPLLLLPLGPLSSPQPSALWTGRPAARYSGPAALVLPTSGFRFATSRRPIPFELPLIRSRVQKGPPVWAGWRQLAIAKCGLQSGKGEKRKEKAAEEANPDRFLFNWMLVRAAPRESSALPGGPFYAPVRLAISLRDSG